MVYESGFTTRRTYTTRPIVTSYSVTLPVVTKFSRVYKTSYPIYSTGAYTRGSRVFTSPVRVVTSPARVITRVIRSPSPPVRVIRTTRVITSPERISSYSYTTPTYSYSSSPYITTSSYLPSTYLSTYTLPTSTYLPSYTYTPISRLYTRSLSPVRVTTTPLRVTTPSYLKRTTLPGYGARALTKYLGTEPFTTFKEETDRIRHRAQSLIRDVHTPVIRQSRSTTPFPAVLGWEPYDKLALDAYVARITNPVRHVAKEVHRMSMYAEPARKYVGKSHLASVRICGNRSYDIRKPMYDTDRIHTDINLLSWYMRHPTKKQEKNIEVNEKKVESVETDPDLDPHRPSRKFSAPRSLEDPEEDVEMKEKQRLRQERLMTVAEEAIDEVDLAKKKAQRLDEKKRREQKAVEDEAKRKAEEVATKKREEQERTAKQAAQKAKEIARREEEERLRKEEEEKAVKAAEEAERKAKEEAEKRQAEEEERKKLLEEEAKKAAEEARLAEETKKAEEAARLAAEETARKAAEAARLAEEQRIREEELQRLAKIEKQAEEEKEAELARQAAELAELARQESEIAAQELQAMQQQSEEKENIETGEPEKNLANEQPSAEPIIEEPLSPISPEIDNTAPPSQEPNIEMNIDGGDAAEWDDLENASYDNSEDDYDN